MAQVSVLIPVYNTEKYIRQSIESVLRQTFTDFELIIVDDCSTDNTYAICAEYAKQDARIRLVRNEHNLGMMKNWNRGLALCQGEFFAKLDADDWWDERMLMHGYTIMQQYPEVGLVFSQHALVDAQGDLVTSFENILPAYAADHWFDGAELVRRGTYGMLEDNVMKQGIGLIRAKVFQELGPFSLHDAGDTEMWFRIAAHYKVYGINACYHYYRIWPDNFTRTKVLNIGKRERNLCEVRQLIFDYYKAQGRIDDQMWRQFSKENQFELRKALFYQYRVQRKGLLALKALAQNLVAQPAKTLNFYKARMLNRNSSIQ